jgi:hypothetical protein
MFLVEKVADDVTEFVSGSVYRQGTILAIVFFPSQK